MKLTIPLNTFIEKTDALAHEGNDLCAIDFISPNQLDEYMSAFKKWDENAKSFLQQSFDEPENNFYSEYKDSNLPSTEPKKADSLNVDDIKAETKSKVMTLLCIKEMLRESDLIINPDDPEIAKRKDFAITQKEEFLLLKLYNLYPKGKYYSVKNLLQYNGIPLNSDDDDIKICNPMKKMGQLDIVEIKNGIAAKITEGGMKYVEESMLKLNKEPIKQLDSALESKFNTVIEELNKQGLVQEIVFDEITDLRQLIHKLTPKQWREMVLGKLVDLGVQQSVKNDTLKTIYEKLTDEAVVFSE